MSISISGNGGITGATTSYSFDQSVSIGGTLTYEDVTNIDSVGIITAQSGIRVTGGALVIGGTDSSAKLNVFGGDIQIGTGLTFKSSSSNGNLNLQGGYTYPGGWIKLSGGSSDDNIVFGTSSNNVIKEERLRIDSSGRLLVGTTASETINGDNVNLQIKSTGASAGLSIHRSENNNAPPYINLALSRAGAVVSDNDPLGAINFFGHDGTDLNSCAAQIAGLVDGTPGGNDMPGRIVFSTTADGASSPSERMRISSEGYVTTPNTPAFKCSIASDSSPNAGVISENNGFSLATSSDRDAFNNGSHFSEATGRFTAPVAGLYYFHFSLMRLGSGGSGPIEMRIKKEGNLMYARAYKASYSVAYESCNVSTITNMAVGEYVEFTIGSSMTTYDDDSYIMGYLIG